MFFNKLRQQMKGIIILVVVAFALTLLYVGGAGVLTNQQPTAEAVARVNGTTIDALELRQAYLAQVNMYRQFGQNVSRVQEEAVRFNTLRQLIDYEIMLQAAKDERVTPSRTELDERMNQLKEYYGESFRDILRQQGMTEREVRDLISEEMQVEAIRTQKSSVAISDADVRAAYDRSLIELNARHILVEPEPLEDGGLDWDSARAQAEELSARLADGADFAELAKEHSDDTGSAESGGEIGWVSADSPLVSEFIDALFALEVNEVSAPVRSQFGYHIIQATEQRERETEAEPFEDVKESLREQLESERGEAQFLAWLNEKRENAEVAILDPQLRAYQFVQNNRLDQAIAQYREAISANPGDPYLYYRLASVLDRVDAADEALDAYKTAAEMGSGDPQLWFALGQAYQEREENEQARDAYVRASELSPNDLVVHQILQQIFTELGEEELAEAEATKITEIQAIYEEQARQQQEQQAREQELLKQLEAARQSDEAEGDGAPETPSSEETSQTP